MKAVIATKYGPPEVLEFKEIEKPEINPDEILIKMKATSVSVADVRIRGAIFPDGFSILARLALGLFAPRKKILGVDFAGEIVEVGPQVQNYKIGDRVFGIDSSGMGAYAEYKKVKSNAAFSIIPSNLTYEEATSLVFGGSTALDFLTNKYPLKSGQNILINGASGAVGTAAVQIAKSLGANITAVCSSKNVDLVKNLGANDVIDYTSQSIFDTNTKFDLVMDAVGNLKYKDVKTILKPNGKFMPLAPSLSLLTSSFFRKNIIAATASETVEGMKSLSNLEESTKIKPVIDKIYSFDEIVDAHRYVQKGHKTGSVVLRF